ncbi:MAG: helix-turn-helix domain-containing protein [Crocinitomix sp.]|nr:helix-turn-helix domain-containing protein [Crocinitomix sp.]
MIPTHDLDNNIKVPSIRIVKLDELTNYDSTKPHRHNYIELFYFNIGSGSHDIDFNAFPIESGSVHLVSSGRVHKVKRDLKTNGFVILFEASIFDSNSSISNFLFDHSCYDVNEFSPIYRFDKEVSNHVSGIITNIWNDYNSENELKNEFIVSNLCLLLITCMRSITRTNVQHDKNQEIYLSFRKLLHQKYKIEKSVKAYALELNVSEKQLHKIVKDKTGLSTSELIYGQVILEAKRLLNAGVSSKEIAYSLNFSDPAHFSKFFKLKVGMSPKEFRNLQD